ncbi:MAG: ABC transporter ATP-binding protein, partial [Solirubrobacteraceae bacterium]
PRRAAEPAGDAVIECRGLTKRYGRRVAVDDLTLRVPEGAICGLLGPNGAGKTTAIRMLLGLARPTAGSGLLLGSSAGDPGFAEVMRGVGAMVEGPALYLNAGARSNLAIRAAALGISPRDGQLDEILAFVGLADRARGRVRGFSLGMRQRLGLGLALLGHPRLVILDEPTNGLDPAGIVEIRELIAALPARGTTVLVSSHLLAEVQLMCDRVAIIDHGRLVADGAIGDVLASATRRSWEIRTPPGGAHAAAAGLIAAGLPAVVASPTKVTLAETGAITGRRVIAALAAAGVEVDELRHDAPNLEQAFLALTAEPTS